jgi:FkbM family methyltransferase
MKEESQMNIPKVVHLLPRFFRRHKLVKLLLLLSPESRAQLITYNGSSRLFIDMADPVARSYFFAGGYDPEFFSVAKPFLSKGGVFFDVGANFGFCSFGLMGCLSRNDVEYHLFEANTDICRLLLRSVALHPDKNIQVNNCCVTDNLGVSRLNLVYSNFGGSFISERGTQEVNNLILDDYIHTRFIDKINLLKIDVEGWEVHALRGAMNSLTSGIVDAVYIEASTENLSRAGFSVEDCFSLLKDAGFHLFFFRSNDFKSVIADKRRILNLNINGYPVKVARLSGPAAEYHTDILALHKSSHFLDSL